MKIFTIGLLALLAVNFANAVNVQFRVNMSVQVLNGKFDQNVDRVYIRGAFNGWSNLDTLFDSDHDLIYQKTISQTANNSTYFMFAFHDASTGSEVSESINNRIYYVPDTSTMYTDYFNKDSSYTQPTQSCPANMLQNGGFTLGLNPWTIAYGNPDYMHSLGCQDTGFISMWGNQNQTALGEGIQQNVTFRAGNTYAISFCGRWEHESKRPYPPRFEFRASNTPLSGPQDSNGTIIGISEEFNIENTWVSNVPISWTPTQDYTILTISITNQSNTNHTDSVTYSYIDNVCITEKVHGDTAITFQGLRHTGLGAASLANIGDSSLIISNLGSSGNDGVRIFMPDSVSSWYALIPNINLTTLPESSFILRTKYATVNERQNVSSGSTYLMKLQNNSWEIGIDYSAVGVSSYTLEMYNRDTLVYRKTDLTPVKANIPTNTKAPWRTIATIFGYKIDYRYVSYYDPDWHCWIDVEEWSCNAAIFHPSESTDSVAFDVIKFIAQRPNTLHIGSAQYIDIKFSDIPAVTFSYESHSVNLNNIGHANIGNARVSIGNNNVLVSNIGSSGKDGVRILPPNALTFDANIGPPYDAISIPTGAFIKFSATGMLSNGVTIPVGSMTLMKRGIDDQIAINVDYNPLGASSYSVKAYNGDSLVYSGTGFSSNIGTTIRTPNDLHWKHHPLINNSSSSMIQHGCTGTWEPPVPIDISNGPSVMVSRLAVSPENDSVSINYFTNFDITAKELDSFYIWNEIIDQVPPDEVVESGIAIPTIFSLEQNYPNPFNPTTVIRYQLPLNGRITLNIFNVLGQEIATLLDEVQEAGFKSIEWNASDVPSGIYFYRLTAGSFTDTKKLVLIK